MQYSRHPSADGPIPVVDIAPFRTRDAAARDHVAARVRAACEDTGFFLVSGHGFSRTLLTRIGAASREFFDLPVEEKRRVGESGPVPGGLMYFGHGAEALGATLGAESIGDIKETLDFGPGFLGDAWPREPADLEPAWRACYEAMSDLALTLRHVFARALDLDADSFDKLFEGHLSSLRVINYPEQTRPPLPGQLRAGAHSDYGVLTILATDDAPGGLEVLKRDGSWCGVPHVAGTFVVNIGDAMMRWTDDHWVSTQHRVVNPPQNSTGPTRRQSIAYFHNLPRDTIIECLEPFRQEGRQPKYPPISYGEYAELRYRQAHGEDKNLDL